MNKSEKIIVAILGLLLVGYFWHSTSQAKKEAEEQAKILREQAAAREDARPPSAAFTAAAPAARASFWSVFEAMPGNERCR